MGPPRRTKLAFCYVADNGEQHVGDAALVANCPQTQHQLIRMIGTDLRAPLPANRGVYFFECADGGP